MAASAEESQLVASPVTTEKLRACLVYLGWKIILADEQLIVAELHTKGVGHEEFSVSVTWQAKFNNVLLTVRVAKKSNSERSLRACERQVKVVLEAIAKVCGEAAEAGSTVIQHASENRHAIEIGSMPD